MPVDVAVTGDDMIFVVDDRRGKVVRFNAAGRLSGYLDLAEPTAVACGGGYVYAGSARERAVAIFDSRGTRLGHLGAGPGEFGLPLNIAVDGEGRVYVVDQADHSIKAYTPDGTFLARYADGDNLPQDVAVANNRLYVIDRPLVTATGTGAASGSSGEIRGARILVLNENGGKVFEFGSYGNRAAMGEFIRPKGVAADSRGNIYVTDAFHGIVIRFAADGTSPQVFQDTESPLVSPQGVTISRDGRLLVASAFTGAVRVYGVDPEAGADSWLNPPPTAVAGLDLEVTEGDRVILDGRGSTDANGTIVAYAWRQIDGRPTISLAGSGTAAPEFTAPEVGPGGEVFVFELTVTDDGGRKSVPASCRVRVANRLTGSLVINDGASHTRELSVSLTVDAPGAAVMRFSNDGAEFSSWLPAEETAVWRLAEGEDGERTVYGQFRDTVDAENGVTATAADGIVLDTAPPPPPAAMDTDRSGPAGSVTWRSTGTAYRFQYADNPEFGDPVTMETAANSFSVPEGLAAGTWYWRVRSVDAAGNLGPWSAVGVFTVGDDSGCVVAAVQPPILAPEAGAHGVSLRPLLRAGDYTGGAACGAHWLSEWQISGSGDFSDKPVLHAITVADKLTSYQVPAMVLTPASRYYWRVRYRSARGVEFPWSVTGVFQTGPESDDSDGNGIPDYQEVPAGVDMDGDGEEDRTQKDVRWFRIMEGELQLGAGAGAGGTVLAARGFDPETTGDLLNPALTWPLGLVALRLSVPAGTEHTVSLRLPEALAGGSLWYTFDTAYGWREFERRVGYGVDRRVVNLRLEDGGDGDADGVENGIIAHLSGPVLSPGRSGGRRGDIRGRRR